MLKSKHKRYRKCKDCLKSFLGITLRCDECRLSRRQYSRKSYYKRTSNLTPRTRGILLIKEARKRAKKSNIDFDLNIEWFLHQIKNQNNKCALTRKKFTLTMDNPWQPSIDRIDSLKGYTQDNCRVVAYCVNLALNKWGDKVFKEMCNAVARNK